jgi:hypothetical protein
LILLVAVLKLPQPGLIPTLDFAFSVDDVDEALDIRNPREANSGVSARQTALARLSWAGLRYCSRRPSTVSPRYNSPLGRK